MSASVLTQDGETLEHPDFGAIGGRDGEQARQFLVKASFGGLTFSANQVHRTKQLPSGSYETLPAAPNRTMDARGVAQLGYAREFAPGLALALQATWGRTDYVGDYYYADYHYPDSPGATEVAAHNIDGGHARWYGLGAHLTVTRFGGHKILVGAEAERDTRRDQFNFYASPYLSVLDDRRSANRRGVFVEDELRLGERILVNASLRHDQHNTGARSNSPRLAVLYRLSGRGTLKLIHGRAFRVPNAYEMYYQTSGEGAQLANPDLAPERIATTEAVLDHAVGADSHARLSLFTYDMHDLIAQQADAASGMLVYRNVERARARGLEASIEHVFAGNARVRASYTWQRAVDGDGRTLIASPRHLAKLNASLPLPALRARLGAELQCMSSRLTERASVGGYCVSNLSLSSTRLVPGAELSAGLHNLADRRYADPAGPAFVQDALQRQRRSAYARIAYGF
jgi:iron complex outermembrane receptor protein